MNKKETLKELGAGYAIGAANIIPGVSGGTFLLILGLYEKVINILNNLGGEKGKELLKTLFEAVKKPTQKKGWKALFSSCQERGIFFLLKLVGGAGLAIVTLSALMEYLLSTHHTLTYAFFFGLIAASVIVPLKLIKGGKLIHLLPFFIGIAITVSVATSFDPFEKAKSKSQYNKEKAQLQNPAEITESKTEKFTFVHHYEPSDYLFIAIAGAIAISAMVLPGLSGSLVLILMGQYLIVLKAISGLKDLLLDHFLFLGCMSVGMALGLLIFVKLINFVFHKFHDGTMSFLTGLIAGSLFALWPFKVVKVLAEQYVKNDAGAYEIQSNVNIYTNVNSLPLSMTEGLLATLCIALGIIVMIPFIKSEK